MLRSISSLAGVTGSNLTGNSDFLAVEGAGAGTGVFSNRLGEFLLSLDRLYEEGVGVGGLLNNPVMFPSVM